MPTPIPPLTVRRSVWIDAPPDRVWREFETFEGMNAWFGTGHDLFTYEPRLGGWVEFGGEDQHYGGRILTFDPPRELTFEDARVPEPDPGLPVLITFRLEPMLNGTHVELIVHGFEQLGARGPDRHRGLEAGWTSRQLNRLKDLVEARPSAAAR